MTSLPAAAWLDALVVPRPETDVGAVIACDHDGDRGIFNLGTVPEARRRGVGRALAALQRPHLEYVPAIG